MKGQAITAERAKSLLLTGAVLVFADRRFVVDHPFDGQFAVTEETAKCLLNHHQMQAISYGLVGFVWAWSGTP